MRSLTKKIFVLHTLAFAIALIAAYISNYIDPAGIPIFAFFGLAYPVILLGNIILFFFWFWRRSKYALISIIVIVVGLGNSGRYFRTNIKTNPNDSTSLKLLTYNVRIFNYFDWEKDVNNPADIASYVNDKDADIVFLQEYLSSNKTSRFSEKNINTLLKKYPYRHIQYKKSLRTTSSRFGIATYSKYRIINRGVLSFEDSFNSCIYSDILYNKDTLRFYNLHLQSIRLEKHDYDVVDSIFHVKSRRIHELKDLSDRFKTAYIRRSEQVSAIKEHINSSPYDVIICGDFNDTPVSFTYNELVAGKTDAFCEAGFGIGNTYRGRLPSYRIDYVFHNKQFKTEYYKTDKVKLSDHYPVYVVLSKQVDDN